ncbi:bola-like protein [Pluteus cervinus]|uniref:Bola-like protein n=1 Tax=Pluteus cervinus TaxID=181527 RepID=A0ACD3B9J2_9AGAR|nr:bola-like protein [Pluteus cervinus]
MSFLCRRLFSPISRLTTTTPTSLSRIHAPRLTSFYSTNDVVDPPTSEGEQKLVDMLKAKLTPTRVRVQDVSGGCGTFYAIEIESEAFKGLSMVKQHKLVSEALKQEIEGMHGLQIKTLIPS